MLRKALLVTTAPILIALTMGGASAQAATTVASADPGNQLQEVVVTAEKHEATVQRTAATVEVVGAVTLERQRIVTLRDLNSVLNNTQIVPIGVATQVIIRGIGNNFVDPRADPAVATSVNGLFYTRPLPIGFGFLDVSRVEDLEGPQGTLYGRNSAAGALNIITNQPTHTFGGLVQITGGNLGENDLTGVLNVPVNDQLALRFAYDRDRRDGYISDRYDDINTDNGRISAKWTPTDKLTAYAEVNYDHIGGHGSTPESYPCVGASAWSDFMPKACAALPPGGFAATSGRQDSSVVSGQVHLDYDLGWATVTSITGYVGTHQRAYTLPNGAYFTNTDLSDNNDYSEEFRIAGHDTANHKGGLAWQVGAYLFDSSGNYFFHTQLPTSNFPPTATQAFTKIPQSSQAGYAQVTYGLLDNLRITGGVRYTADSKGIDYFSQTYLPIKFTVLGPAVTGATKTSSNKFTYKGGLEYDLAPHNLLYATISTGYAAGGVNGGSTTAPLTPKEAMATFQPETITAYEVGSKNRFLDNRLQINGDVYYYDFQNYQYLFPAFVQGGGNVHGLEIQDAASVTAYGVELSADFAITRDDRLSASLSWTHATFGALQFAGFAPPTTATETIVPAGSQLVNDPEWSALVGYEHTWRMGDGSSLTAGVNTKFSSRYLLIVGSTVPADYQKAYSMTDANLAYHWHDDKYQIRVWAKNLENVPVNTYGEGAGFNLYGIEAPRTYGVTATARF